MDPIESEHELQYYRLLRRAVFAPLLIALVVAGLFFFQIQHLRTAFAWVEHTNQVISQAHGLEKLLIDAQNGVRGFMLTGETSFLEPLDDARATVLEKVAIVAAMTTDNPAQNQLFRESLHFFDTWMVEVGRNVAIRTRWGTAPFDVPGAWIAKSAPIMKQARDRLDRFLAREEQLLSERALGEDRTAKIALLSGLLFAVLLAIVLMSFTRRLLMRLSRGYQIAIDRAEESREWFKTTLRSIGDAVMVVDLEARVEFLNPVAEKLTGWKLSDAKGRPMADTFKIVNQETRAPAFNPVDKVLKEGIVAGLANHTILISRNGNESPIEDSAAPIQDSRGKILGVVLVFRDVSEKHLIQSELQDSQKRFQAVANAAPVLIWTSDQDQQSDWFNEEWLGFRGRTMKQELGRGWVEGLHPDDVALCLKVYGQSFEARKPFEAEYRILRFDGTYRWMLDRGVPRQDAKGRFLGFIGSCIDITERREARIQLEKLATDLRAAVQVRDDFLSVASHELKTPLTSLKLQLQMTERSLHRTDREPPTVEKLARTVATCLGQTDRLASLVDDLLDVSRIQSGKLTYQMEPVDLAVSALESGERLSEQAELQHSRLTVIAPQPVFAHCDRFRMDQVFTNLITNAIKYGNGNPIEVEVQQEGAFAKIIVRDQGIGIAHENQQIIFGRFERAIGSTNISGLGLGLYIVRQIVQAHRGTVEVASQLGSGSTFTVTLPCSAPG